MELLFLMNFFKQFSNVTTGEVTMDDMKKMILHTEVIIGIILLVNCYLNFDAGVKPLAYLDLVSGVVIIILYFSRKIIPLFFSAMVVFLIIILLNYFIVELMGAGTGNIFYYIVLPLGFSLIFQKYHSYYTIVLFALSGIALFLGLLWDNPLLDSIAVSDDQLQRKFIINLSIAFVLTALFVYRYIRFYTLSNEHLMKEIKAKETLLTEVHHRVKNNLNIILGMIQIQRMEFMDKNKGEESNYLLHLEKRVYAIAKVHEMLFSKEEIKSEMSLHAYLTSLADEVLVSFDHDITIEVNIPDQVSVNLEEAIPIGLILNELILNSVEHGMKDLKQMNITIDFSREKDTLILRYEDSGEKFDYESLKNQGVGLSLIETLTQQIGGTSEYKDGVYWFFWEFPENN